MGTDNSHVVFFVLFRTQQQRLSNIPIAVLCISSDMAVFFKSRSSDVPVFCVTRSSNGAVFCMSEVLSDESRERISDVAFF